MSPLHEALLDGDYLSPLSAYLGGETTYQTAGKCNGSHNKNITFNLNNLLKNLTLFKLIPVSWNAFLSCVQREIVIEKLTINANIYFPLAIYKKVSFLIIAF